MNTKMDLIRYFASGGKLVLLSEFYPFWESLKPADRLYYTSADLTLV